MEMTKYDISHETYLLESIQDWAREGSVSAIQTVAAHCLLEFRLRCKEIFPQTRLFSINYSTMLYKLCLVENFLRTGKYIDACSDIQSVIHANCHDGILDSRIAYQLISMIEEYLPIKEIEQKQEKRRMEERRLNV